MPDLRSHFCVTKVYFYIILSLVVTYGSHFCVTKIPLSCLIRPSHQIFTVFTAQPGSLPLFFLHHNFNTLSTSPPCLGNLLPSHHSYPGVREDGYRTQESPPSSEHYRTRAHEIRSQTARTSRRNRRPQTQTLTRLPTNPQTPPNLITLTANPPHNPQCPHNPSQKSRSPK